MLFDWFTFCAQVVNFLILVWLLKRYLYGPILKAIEEREARIAAQIHNAEAREDDARTERETYERKNEAFELQRDSLLNESKSEAAAEHARLLADARSEYESLRARWRESLKVEQDVLGAEIVRRAQSEVLEVARKALGDLAGASLEERIVVIFLRRMGELGREERELLTSTLRSSHLPVLVRSSCELPPAQRAEIEHAVKAALQVENPVRFETTPNLLGGIELITNGHKVAWSLADYLDSLRKSVMEVLDGKAGREAAVAGEGDDHAP